MRGKEEDNSGKEVDISDEVEGASKRVASLQQQVANDSVVMAQPSSPVYSSYCFYCID